MSMPSGYSIADYGDMVDCEPRMPIYAEALKRAVTPGCSVIDIGAGFGIFALLACKYGAGSVVAIETDSSIELLHELAQANGYADRITIVRGLSTEYTPERKADVIISDLRGTVPLFEHHISAIRDARERLLAKGGHLLPMRDTLRVALVRSPTTYRAAVAPWKSNGYGLDLSAGRRFAVNDSSKVYLNPSALVSEPVDLATLDYRSMTEPNVDGAVELVAKQDCEAQGLLVWFDAEIAEGLTYSNAPGEPKLVYGQMFLPLAEPMRLKKGETVTARIRANLLDSEYIFSWDCDGPADASGKPSQRFRQSTFLRRIIPTETLQPGANTRVPESSPQIVIDRDCLDLVGEGRNLGEIAAALLERHPEHLQSYDQALESVADLMRRYK